MLTLDDGDRTIAWIKGGKLNGSILSISDNGENKISLERKGGQFEPIPSTTIKEKKGKISFDISRENILICGASGSGKSTWMAMYVKHFHKIFPKAKIYLFSRLEEDKVLDKLGCIERILIDENLVNDPIDIHSEEVTDGSLMLFDDIDSIIETQVKDVIWKLIIDIIETGRHKNIYCCITRHLLYDNSNINKKLYNELHRLVIFPHGGNRNQMISVLKNQFGIDGGRITQMMNLKTRWLCVSKTYPLYFFGQLNAEMI